MKRVGNLYAKITSLDNLALAHRHAKRGKVALDFKRKMRKMANKKTLSDHDRASIQAYKGWLKHCNSYNLTQKYLAPLEKDEEDKS